MNKQNVLKELQQKYPGKTIICIPEDDPKEILCEVEPAHEHPDYSVAIAVIDQSSPHIHKVTTEVYEVIEGSLIVNKDAVKYPLNQGESITINPGEVHFAEGNETWIKATSHPGWSPSDHILVNTKTSL